MVAQLTLRPVGLSDERAVLSAHRTLLADDFDFALGYRQGMDWASYVALLDELRRVRHLPEPWVPATFLVATVGGTIVGRTSIRHRLNDHLLATGGHIGYAVLPDHRRHGYATEMLRQSLVIARSFDVSRVLVTCDENNEASARTIMRCGGVLDDVVEDPHGGPRKCRYWIE